MLRHKGSVSPRIGITVLTSIIVLLLILPGCTINNTETTTVTATMPVTVTSTVTTTRVSTVTTTVTAGTTTTSRPPTTTTSSTTAPPTTSNYYSITEALSLGLVTITINGYSGTTFGGVSSGDVVTISFLRQKPQSMHISVPMGTTLISNDATSQNMVILELKGRDPSILGYYPVTDIYLTKDEPQKYLFEAYCLNMSKSNIYTSDTFAMGSSSSPEVLAVLNAAKSLDAEKATISAIQTAIWTLTDNPTYDELQKRFNADSQTLAGAWAILDKAGLNPGSRNLFIGYTPG